MKLNIKIVPLLIAMSSTSVLADTCEGISEINSLYRTVVEKKATDIQIKRLQQEVGVVADGKWGRMSEAAYTALLKRCDSYSYPTEVVQIGNATITDFVSEKTVFEQLAVPVCTNQRLPIYGQVQVVNLGEDAAHYIKFGNPVRVSGVPKEGWVRLYEADGEHFIGLGEIDLDGNVAPRRLMLPPEMS